MSQMAKRGSGGSSATSRKTPDALIAAATAMLAERGYTGATARAIADRAHCNQALVFYHFGTVDRLLLAVLDAVSARRMATVGAQVDRATTPTDLIDALETVITQDLRGGDLAVLVALLDAARGNPRLREAVREVLQPWHELTERIIRRITAAHPLGAFLPVPAAARLTMATVLGLELLAVTDSDDGSASLADLLSTLRLLGGSVAVDPPPKDE